MNNEQAQHLMNRYGFLAENVTRREVVIDLTVGLDHLETMPLLSSPELFDDQKMQRWLGFMQGVLWAYGVRTLEELKNDVRETKTLHPQTDQGSVLEVGGVQGG